jgi:hypothetical protein
VGKNKAIRSQRHAPRSNAKLRTGKQNEYRTCFFYKIVNELDRQVPQSTTTTTLPLHESTSHLDIQCRYSTENYPPASQTEEARRKKCEERKENNNGTNGIYSIKIRNKESARCENNAYSNGELCSRRRDCVVFVGERETDRRRERKEERAH